MKPKICVAMSGGVDSSVAALLLKERGYDVFGVFMKLWDDEGAARGCCSLDDSLDALRVAERLKIPFYVLNMKQPFQERVVRYFIDEYRAGRTPNPCIYCNRILKFDLLLTQAATFGASMLATGHYARIEDGKLMKAVDGRKDQSYFLFDMPGESLAAVTFPLGGLHKDEVRRIAEREGLKTARKRESQEICFVKGDYRDFLHAAGIAPKKGYVVDTNGRVLGEHQGYFNFTVGQRSGLNIALGYPVYVVKIIPAENLVIAGREEQLYRTSFIVDRVNILQPLDDRRYSIRIRSRHPGGFGSLASVGEATYRVEFETPQRGITPGQAAVFYDGDQVAGGGWIREVR